MNDEALTTCDLSNGPLCEPILDFCTAEAIQLYGERTIHSLFEDQVARTPDAPAVVSGDRSLTYAELNSRADRLATALRALGIGRDELVGVCVDRSVDMFVALLATFKAGGAYVPLDPSYPAERLGYMLEDCKPHVVLVQSKLRYRLPPTAAALLAVDEEPALPGQVPNSPRDAVTACGRDLAYVIYTSGSTGQPKGVMIEHRSVLALWHGLERLYASAPGCDRVALNASLSFDASVQQLVQLLSGRTLFVVPDSLRRDAPKLLEFLAAHRIQAIDCTPSQLQTWVAAGLLATPASTMRLILVGGEAIDRRLWVTLSRSEHVQFHNVYGPTECTVDVTAAHVNGDPGEPHLGRPMLNRRIYILNHGNEPAAVGTVGEICIGGAGVGRGYLNRPELTATRFMRDPFAAEPDARLYRSGDFGRWRADGTIEYLGRDDQQVKVRGFRIELGEIEAQLLQHASVREVAVMLREDATGDQRLVAYATQHESNATSVMDLRTFLRSRLPEYMVPAAFVLLKRMPLTPSGKLDRRALPAPDAQAYVRRPYEPPRGDSELALVRACEELLGVDGVGRDDNFFELGGHSLLIVQLLGRLRRVGLHLEVTQIYACQALCELAAMLRPAEQSARVPANLIPPGCETITPAMLPLVQLHSQHIERIARQVQGGAGNIQDIYPLTPLQEGLLFHHLLDDRSAGTYVVATILSVASRQGVTDLIAAFQAVIDRHDVLRTAILWEEGLPQAVQVVQRCALLSVEEIALDPSRDPLAQLEEWLDSGAARVDIRSAPLLRLQVAVDPSRLQWHVLLLAHHLTSDHVTLDLVTEEVVEHLQGRQAHLPASVPYRDHVAHVLTESRKRDAETFFRAKLGDVDQPTAPFGLTDVRGDGTQVEQIYCTLDAGLARRIRAHARRLGVSAAALFHAAWALVVAHTSEREDVVFGSILFGRLHGLADAQRALGLFINTLPLRLKLADVGAGELIVRAQRELAELLDYEQTPLAIAQRCSAVVGSTPLFSTLLNYVHSQQNAAAQWSKAPGVRFLAYRERTNYPITVSIEDLGEGFALDVQTDRCIPAKRVAGHLQTAVESLVRALEHAPQTPVLALPILHADESRQLLEQFNPRLDTHAAEELIHEVFERQVERTPDATAVVFEGESISYAALNRRANRLARRLVQQGVQPDELVALCVERGVHLVVGIVAILKASGAYVPLDPSYPAERLAHILADSRPRVLLTQKELRARFADAGPALITVDDYEWPAVEADDDNVRVAGLRPQHLAYVIYTSGSTGKPKGVMVEHRNVTRLFAATAHWFGFDARDVWTLFHSFAFDFSVWELWGALFYGGRVVVVPWQTARSPADFYRLICEQGVTVLNQTPSAFAQLSGAQESLADMRHALRVVIFGGEALELAILRAWVARNGAEQPQLVNMYGITETTVHVTYRRLTQQEIETERGSLIGRPIPDLQVHLLNRYGQPVPIGVAGEVHVGGAGVARGYLNRPELTAERFLSNPFASGPPDAAHRTRHMYKSGDLARWRPDGTLEYLGRNDEQVKIRGFRIELGEIQSRLLEHEGVRDAAVVVRTDAGEQRLVAYVVPHAAGQPPTVVQLRSQLQHVLPEYMVPAAFVVVETLPLTSNGKLDRRALPVPDLASYVSQRYEAPEGVIEQALAAIWQELLKVQRVGRDDDVFELGGHSLLAMQIVGRIRASLAVDLPVRFLFQFPTVRQLAVQVEQLRGADRRAAVAAGTSDAEELLERVASLPESEVQELLKELRTEARS